MVTKKKSIKETQKDPKRPVGIKIGPKETQRDPKRPSRDPVGKFECEFCNSEFKNRTHLYNILKIDVRCLKNKEENEI